MINISSDDVIFGISRSVEFINLLRDTHNVSVVSTDNLSTFLGLMKSVPDIVILANAQDFTDY